MKIFKQNKISESMHFLQLYTTNIQLIFTTTTTTIYC